MVKKKVVNIRIAIIVANEAEDVEVVIPYDLWKRAGFIVDTISIEKKNTLFLQSGIKISCDESLESTNIDKYNAIYLPGGRGYLKLIDERSGKLSKKLIRFANDPKKWLFCAGMGTIVLVRTNAIFNQKITTLPGYEEQVEGFYQASNVLINKNFISTKGGFYTFQFALVVIKSLLDQKIAQSIADSILYNGDI